jgi:UDPglucose 6-dehydrogenase
MKIAVIGTGYVGLVTGTCFAETGNQVTCVDIDQKKVDSLTAGRITIYEPGLEVMFERNLRQHRLSFTTDLKKGIKDAEIIFLALPTPPGEDGSADLRYVLNVAEELGQLLTHYVVVVDKSTVPVGTADKVRARIAKNASVEFDVVSNPEFLREGVAVEDFMKPDRVVVGTSSERARKVMETLYTPFVRQGNPIVFMDERSAELTKYAANSFLATKISFMNEIANLCELVGADVDSVRKGIGTDSRIGKRFLFPGIGYGGSCFPKDVQALVKSADEVEYDFRILKAVMDVNTDQKTRLIQTIHQHYPTGVKGKTFAFWGLSFKPHTDDIREAPALYNIDALLKAGANVQVHDPEAMAHVKKTYGSTILFFDDPYLALEKADALFIATEWPEFRSVDFARIKESLRDQVIFDGRNLYDLSTMKGQGITYYSIGREVIHG